MQGPLDPRFAALIQSFRQDLEAEMAKLDEVLPLAPDPQAPPPPGPMPTRPILPPRAREDVPESPGASWRRLMGRQRRMLPAWTKRRD